MNFTFEAPLYCSVKDKSSTISYKKKSNAFEHNIFWNWAILLLMFGEGSGYDSGYR